MVLETLGGLGVFLLGMVILTDGLHALAGNKMHDVLVRFTSSPITGALTGATTTAILQSSSAITVAAVGFVGAGLLSFSSSLGIIFGANIGTTITGWLVVLLGFKLKLGTLILPLILLGALLRLFAKNRLATAGYTLAGFGLIFVGISMMQQGMAGVETLITPAHFPPDTWTGRLQLLLYGIIFTLLTQSSSAGVATALTALYAGAINFNQAAVLVIGMDVGTTVTAAMATVGASVNSRRTGYSHVIYNLFTACGALLLLTPFILLCTELFPGQINNNPEVALVAFHTFFNGVGVIVVLPFTKQFARLMEHLVKQSPHSAFTSLDLSLVNEPSVALSSVLATVKRQLTELLSYIRTLTQPNSVSHVDFVNLQLVLDDTHAFVDRIHLDSNNKPEWQRLLNIIHILDHMQRMHERCAETPYFSPPFIKDINLADVLNSFDHNLNQTCVAINQEHWDKAFKLTKSNRKTMSQLLSPIRAQIMTDIALGKLTVPQATSYMEALRWLQRISNHLFRISYHMQRVNNKK